jgi:hypothetical protein
MQTVEVARVAATYRCHPKAGPGCGADVPVSSQTCRSCRRPQHRPVAPPAGPLLSDCILIDADTRKPIGLAASVSPSAAGFVAAAARKYGPRLDSRARLSGIGDRQAMFGTLAPVPLRQRYGCTRSAVARDTDVASWRAVAIELHAILGTHLPDVAAGNVYAARNVADIWKFPGTGWTSGVLNLTQLLPYHRDAGNLAESWSAMIGARSKVDGGHLYLPEYDVTLDVGHRSLVAFPGATITHGVTPMSVGRGGWRVTAVFYGLRGCVACADTESAEIARIAARATARARIMAAGGAP